MTENDTIRIALQDQFQRCQKMLEGALQNYPLEEWKRGDLAYLRPAGLAYHLIETIDYYISGLDGDHFPFGTLGSDCFTPDSAGLPDKEQTGTYLALVNSRLEAWLAETDFLAPETLHPYTGTTVLSRAMYLLRHCQHHISELYIELTRRGLPCPEWE